MSGAALLLALCFALPQAASSAARPELPPTVAEASRFARTSTSAEVEAFVDACVAASPKLARLSLATSTKGRDVPLVVVADPPAASLAAARAGGKLPVLVFANIHAGEVEGKEAVQQLLREFASGDHAELLARLAIAFVPNLNPDGNDALDRKNRPDQNGPIEGVGLRANGQGLDLNRDYVKQESPEIRGLVAAVAELDAALVMDLHTTDGSYHGYELTYAAPQHPATEPALLAFGTGRLLPALRDAMKGDGFATFDYGDFADGAAPEKGWFTFDHRARYGTNYFGLQNRLTLLSEAYSHEPFDVRVRATRAFVLHALRFAAQHGDALRELRRAADAEGAALAASKTPVPRRGALAVTRAREAVLVGECRSEKDPVTGLERVIDTGATRAVEMAVHVSFDGVEPAPLPAAGFAIDDATPELEALLRRHSLRCERLATATAASGTQFRIAARKESARPFQGHRLVETEGAAEPWQGELPAGTLFVPSAQPRARLALLLLDARSDDGLATWGVVGVAADDATRFAVRAIERLGG